MFEILLFFPKTFCDHFSGNPENVTENSIFGVPKTHQKVMKITDFDLLRGPFVYGDQSRRVPQIKQNVAKMHQKSLRSEHDKLWIPVSQWSKRTPSTDLRKCLETRAFLSFPVLLCSRHGCRIDHFDLKIVRIHANRSNRRVVLGSVLYYTSNARREAGQFEVYILKKQI